jgi:hypothetical protein
VQEAQRARLKQAIADAPAESVRLGSVEEAAERFAEEVRLYAPEVTEGAISATAEETQVDISRDRSLSFQYARVHLAGALRRHGSTWDDKHSRLHRPAHNVAERVGRPDSSEDWTVHLVSAFPGKLV